MNDRLQISSAVPADRAEVMSDLPLDLGALDDAADAIEAENARMAKQNAGIWLHDAEFWKEELLDSDLGYLAQPLADAMKNLDDACKGNVFAVDRICQALSRIERIAKPLAEKQLIDIYGSEK